MDHLEISPGESFYGEFYLASLLCQFSRQWTSNKAQFESIIHNRTGMVREIVRGKISFERRKEIEQYIEKLVGVGIPNYRSR